MSKTGKVDNFVKSFKDLSENDKKEAMKQIMPGFCQIAMKDKAFMQEMMPNCISMMKDMDVSMKEMMSKMMNMGNKNE